MAGLVPQYASASSRFTTVEIAPSDQSEASASLDFAIVVPEILSLSRVEPGSHDQDTASAGTASWSQGGQGPFTARVNAGTLAFGTRILRRNPSGRKVVDTPAHPHVANRVYLVAAP